MINNIKIKYKIILSYLIISVLPILLITLILTARIYDKSVDEIVAASQGALNQLQENYTNTFQSQAGVIDALIAYKPLREYVSTDYDSSYEAFKDYKTSIDPIINKYSSQFINDNVGIKIYTNNDNIGYSAELNNAISSLSRYAWYSEQQSVGKRYSWAQSSDTTPGYRRNYLTCYSVVKDTNSKNQIQMVVATFLQENALFSFVNKENNNLVFLCDSDNNVISSNKRDLVGQHLPTMVPQLTDRQSLSGIAYNKEQYTLLPSEFEIESLNIHDWTIYYFISHQEITTTYNEIIRSSTVMLITCLALAFVTIIMVANNITARLDKLTTSIKKISDGDYKARINLSGNDELGQIGDKFNDMIDKMDFLINTVHEADIEIRDQHIMSQKIEMEMKKTELSVLKSQINPHFLFNTLESIKMNLIIKDDMESANIMQIFSESIRDYMQTSNEYVSLERELGFVEKYICIQKYRFVEKFQFASYISDDIKELIIPHLIIQPLVENAVFHGIEPKETQGTVILEASLAKNELHITVTDDGVGMTTERLTELRNALITEQPETNYESLGLRNVHNRIKLIYGEKYGITVNSKIGIGTEVRLVIPQLPS